MKTPIRLRSWHTPIVEDADGLYVCTCATLATAVRIVLCVNTLHSLAQMPVQSDPVELIDSARCANGLPPINLPPISPH